METITLITYIIALFQFGLISTDYEYICNEKLLKKPYVKIYNTKLGELFLDEGPGFYEVGHLKNVYVCTNGPVVLYFTRQTFAGDVFDEARNTLDIHKCQFYNGEPGPTANKKADHLKAILLMGDDRDYTLPSVKTFTAPLLLDENTGTYQNVTSVITLGAQNCEIFKGPLKQSIKLNYLDTEAEFQMCRLAYQTIDRWSKSNENITKDVLNNNNENAMVEGECSKAPEPNTQMIENFRNKKTEMVNLKTQITKLTAPEDFAGKILELKLNISETSYNISSSDNSTEVSVWREAVEKTQIALEAFETQQLTSEMYKQLLAIKDESNFANAESIITASIEGDLKSLEERNEEKKKINAVIHDTDPADPVKMKKLVEDYNVKLQQISTLEANINEAFRAALALMASAEASLNQAKLLLELFPTAEQEAKNAKKAAAAGTKYTSANLIQLKEASQSVPQSIDVEIYGNVTRTVADTVPLAPDICLKLPSVGRQDTYRPNGIAIQSTCYNEKGTKLLGCQMLKARMGEPGVCALDETDSDKDDNPLSPVPAPSDYLPQYMIDVLNLINEIYKKACDRIRPVFAERINNLLQCYLVKDRVMKNQTSTDGTTPTRVKFWGKIITALETCRDEGHALKFARESREVANYYLIKGKEFIEIPFLKEQAENEYGFNFAIDMSWKVFATVLGLCMPSYEPKIPLINTRFFTLYTEEFLQPLEEIWISPKDNNIFKRIMSFYYGVGGYETWATYCMEASFLYASDVSYRPPRKLLVNARTESNYFVKRNPKKRK